MYRYFKNIGNSDHISPWKSKGLSNKTIKPPTSSNNSLGLALGYYDTKTRVKFTGSCFQQDKIINTHGKTVNIYIVYELNASSSNTYDPTLKKSLFGARTLNKNADI